ncbi:protein kinase [Mycolicibacterium sp. S2-37]|uniref:serine/threonine-protein kinase n=1 Tax=Mycolicibacterium sp. S2-37 TaxID=2810297 RepID=UPI001A94EB35|nr:serine/threonine-protein kinase [Mycolicibacterium sp. S2-37]MBO0679152.1 protein kinase [Mycolicibacterium sp. S2-37]
MSGDQTDGGSTPAWAGIATELAAAGFEDAREVGRGASGVVYRCFQTSLGRTVAIKVLASDIDPDNRERFLREGFAMGKLSGHPNIVNILQVGVTPSNRPYIVMPYHSADSLALRLRRGGPIPWPEALKIGVKLCGALETAHKSATLHRDIKPGNVLLTEYGEPQLSDFGIARIAGKYQTVTGVFSGTIAYTAPEVLSGRAPTVAADLYSLGATLYALIAGNAAHENAGGEELIAQYLRITSEEVPDLRPRGIPHDVCAAIEKAMSINPADRPVSAAEFGRDLQAAQRHNGLPPDSMALPIVTNEHEAHAPADPVGDPAPADSASEHTGAMAPPVWTTTGHEPNVPPPPPEAVIPPQEEQPPPPPGYGAHRRRSVVLISCAALAVVLLVLGIIAVVPRDTTAGTAGGAQTSAPSSAADAQPGWRPITNSPFALTAAATTQVDGTIWMFGGAGANGAPSARHEGYDPAIDSWKQGDDLPVPVQHAMAATWQGNPVVLGGLTGPNNAATPRVWRVVNTRWVEMPPMREPRASAVAATIGGRIVVAGGVGADGRTLASTEIFDGTAWKPGADMPTARRQLAGATDGALVYAVGGTNGAAELATVEAYDPEANAWTSLPPLRQARSDLGATIADQRLVVAGGLLGGQPLKSVAMLDLASKTWADLPDMATARYGLAVAAVADSVYAVGGSTGAGAAEVTSSGEAVKLAPRRLQPSPQWRSLPDAPTERLMSAWTVLDGRIYVLGGLRTGAVLDTVESYDPKTGAWQTEPPLPIALHHAAATTYKGEVIVIGGASDNIGQGSDKVFALRSGGWTELPSLTHARAAPAVGAVGDKLIVTGGQNDKQIVAQTEVFDGTTWTEATDMPTPREHSAAVSDGRYFYVLGGRFLGADKNSAAFDRFDPQSGDWVTLPDSPTAHGSFGAAYIDGRIVAVGGEEPTQVIGDVDMFDIADGTWTTLASIPTPRHAAVVAAVGNTVYCLTGANRPTHEGAVATVEALDFR